MSRQSKTVTKTLKQTAGGAAGGAAIGGAIGILGGPIGVILGLILGGLLGGAAGANVPIRKFVTEIWQTPTETVIEMPGGAEAALATMSFGWALYDEILTIAASSQTEIDADRFGSALNTYYAKFLRQMDSEARYDLDNADTETSAFKTIIKHVQLQPTRRDGRSAQ